MHLLSLLSSLVVAASTVGCAQAESAPTTPVEVPVIGAVAQANEAPAASSQFTIEGMHCGSCANSIRTTVDGLDGVVGCELTFDEAVLTVHWADSASDDQVVSAVVNMGYTIALVGDGDDTTETDESH